MSIDSVLSRPPLALRAEKPQLAEEQDDSSEIELPRTVKTGSYEREKLSFSDNENKYAAEAPLPLIIIDTLPTQNADVLDQEANNDAADKDYLSSGEMGSDYADQDSSVEVAQDAGAGADISLPRKEKRKSKTKRRVHHRLSDWLSKLAINTGNTSGNNDSHTTEAKSSANKLSPRRSNVTSPINLPAESTSVRVGDSGDEQPQQQQQQIALSLPSPTMANPTAINGRKLSERRDASIGRPAATSTNATPTESAEDQQEIIVYVVQENDTLERVAAQFKTTPTVIMRLNRLSTRVLFPGQKIRVPDNSALNDNGGLLTLAPSYVPTRNSVSESIVPSSPTADESEDVTQLDDERFVKIETKRVLRDNAEVKGTFLVTPNVVMFDPNVSDPLVLESGMERYRLLAPYYTIRSMAIYKTSTSTGMSAPNDSSNTDQLVPDTTTATDEDSAQRAEQSRQRNSLTEGPRRSHTNSSSSDKMKESVRNSQSNENETAQDESSADGIAKRNGGADVELAQGLNVSGDFRNRSHSSVDPEKSATSPRRKRSTAVVRNDPLTGEQQYTKYTKKYTVSILLQNALPVAERASALLSNTDELLRAAASRTPFDSQPFQFLSITVASSTCGSRKSRLSESASSEPPAYCYEEDVEYWFAVPQSRVEELRAYCTNCMSKASKFTPSETNSWQRGLVTSPVTRRQATARTVKKKISPPSPAVNEFSTSPPFNTSISETRPVSATETDAETGADSGNLSSTVLAILGEDATKEWEVLNANAHARHVSCPGVSTGSPPTDSKKDALDYSPFENRPIRCLELTSKSNLLTDAHLDSLSLHIPPRAQNYQWMLTYSTDTHGFSLNTLYRRQSEMNRVTKPSILVMADTNDNVLGAFLSDPLIPADHFFGTGECFIFSFAPDFRAYHWSGINNYCVKCSAQSIAIGSSHGHNGLWLDSELNRGHTQSCDTFSNQPLIDDAEQGFLVKLLEVWVIQND